MEQRPHQPNRPSTIPDTLTNAEDEFVEFMASLRPTPEGPPAPPSPAPQPQAAGIGHLDALCRLMEQLSNLRQQNCRLQQRVNHLERLQCVHALDRSASGDSLLVTTHHRRGRSRSADGGAAWEPQSCEDLPAHLVAFGRRISGDGVSDAPAPRSTSPTQEGAKSRSLDRAKVAKGMYASSRLQSQGSGKRSSSAWGRVKTIIQTRRDSLRRRCLSPPLEEECKEVETETQDRSDDGTKWQKMKRVFTGKKGQGQQQQQQPAPLQRSQSVPSSPTAQAIFSYEDIDLLSGCLDEGSSSRLSDDAQRHLVELQRNLSHDFSLKMEEWGKMQQERKMSRDLTSQEDRRRKRNSTDGLIMRTSTSENAVLQRGRSRSDTSLAEAASGDEGFRATSEPELGLSPGSASLDRLRVHEEVCKKLQGQLHELDQRLHEMISVHAKELAKYKVQMTKQCGSADQPALSSLEEHLRHVEGAQLRLERTRQPKSSPPPQQRKQQLETNLEPASSFGHGEDNPSSLVHLLQLSQVRGSLDSPSGGGQFVGSSSPRQTRAAADVDVAKIQDLSKALTLQAQQLEDALKERNAAVRQLRWELLATDVQAFRTPRVRKPPTPRPEPPPNKRGWTSLEGMTSLFQSKEEDNPPEETKDPHKRRQEEAFAQELRATVHEMQAGLNVDVADIGIPFFKSTLDDQHLTIKVDPPVRLPPKQEKAASVEGPSPRNGSGGGGVRARRMSDTSVPYDPRAPPQASSVTPNLPWDDLPNRVKLDFASAFSTAIYDDEALQQPIGMGGLSPPSPKSPMSPSSESDSDDSGVTFTLSTARPVVTQQPPPQPPPSLPPRSPLPPRPPSNVRRMIAHFTTPPPSPPCPQRSIVKSSTYATPPTPPPERISKSATVASVGPNPPGPPPRSPCPRPTRSKLPRAQNSPQSPRLPQPPNRQIAAVSPVVMRRRLPQPEVARPQPPDEAKSSFFNFRLCRPRSKRRDSDSGISSPLEVLCRQSLLLDLPHPNTQPQQRPTSPPSSSPCPSSPPPPATKTKPSWPGKLFRPK